jgi:2'-5' RNA ligase
MSVDAFFASIRARRPVSRRVRAAAAAALPVPQGETGAAVMLLPAPGDPVNALCEEDSHVTVVHLGESADLEDGQAMDIAGVCAIVAGEYGPFDAQVSGVALLGEDQARVLLLESAEIASIRNRLMTAPPVKDAMSTTEQFPHYVPHLTLSYKGPLPGKKVPSPSALSAWHSGTAMNGRRCRCSGPGGQHPARPLRGCPREQRC